MGESSGDAMGTAQGLAEEFGLGKPVGMSRAARGAMGAVWELRTTAGAFAAKELFWFDGEMDAVGVELAFRAACAEAGVRSPAPLAGVDGAYVVRHGNGWWRLYEWADGEVPDRSDAEVTSWLAEQMAVIHALDWPGGPPGVVPFYHRVDVDWPALVDAAESTRGHWASALKDLRPRLVELTDLVNAAPIGEQVWCHRDLKNTNVLRSAERSWLVDWDNVGSLAPWRELGALLMHQLDQPENLRRTVAAYRAAGGVAELEGPSGFATGLAIQLNFLHGQATVAMDARQSDDHRGFAQRQLTGLLTSIPDLPLLEKAADAVRG